MAKPVEQMTPEEYRKSQAEIVKKEFSQMPPASPAQFKAQCERLWASRIPDWGSAVDWFHEELMGICWENECTLELALKVRGMLTQRTESLIGKSLLAVANAIITSRENPELKRSYRDQAMTEIQPMLMLSREEYKAEMEQLKAEFRCIEEWGRRGGGNE